VKASPSDQRRLLDLADLDARLARADAARKNPPQVARVNELLARRKELSQELTTRLGAQLSALEVHLEYELAERDLEGMAEELPISASLPGFRAR